MAKAKKNPISKSRKVRKEPIDVAEVIQGRLLRGEPLDLRHTGEAWQALPMGDQLQAARQQLDVVTGDLANLVSASPAGVDRLRRFAAEFAKLVDLIAHPLHEQLCQTQAANRESVQVLEGITRAVATLMAINRMLDLSCQTRLSPAEEQLILSASGSIAGRKAAATMTQETRSKGGKIRAQNLSADERQAIASKAGDAFWKNLTAEERSAVIAARWEKRRASKGS